jgi:hypothetical protein
MKYALVAIGLLGCSAQQAPDHAPSARLQACAASPGAVPTIAAAVDRLNTLPDGPDAACFVASVPRPLQLVATDNVVSAQPAVGDRSPRIFLMMPGLVVSVAPEGDGSKLLEFGQWTTPTRTLKGELAVPVTKHLESSAPFQHALWTPSSTTCSFCHSGEQPWPGTADAYDSVAYRPREEDKLVNVDDLSALHADCARTGDPSARCQLFHALFDFGDVQDGAFAGEVATF